MSITYLDLNITNTQDEKKAKKVRFLVDSGAIYSVLPKALLKSLGIKKLDTQEFMLANGKSLTKDVGAALFEFNGKKRPSPVVFGEKDIYLLGAVTLESLEVALDPINRQLLPLPMLLM